jgi:energy-converting hydrogenase Eha subunit B
VGRVVWAVSSDGCGWGWVIVALKPRYGAYVVAVWLGGIIVSLLTYSGSYDIALRDFGLMLGALTLTRLASVYDTPRRFR